MFKTVQLSFYIYLVACHNIVRLPTVRKGEFEVRHVDKVQSKPHYLELKLESIQVCVDKCVADSQCKSVNFFSTGSLDTCQLVAYDITDNNNYTNRTGWKHYDTGRTKVTRLRERASGYCYIPETAGCEIGDTYIISLPSSDNRCNSLDAYFRYNRDTGLISHYCSGRKVCGTTLDNGHYIMVKTNCNHWYAYNNNLLKRWRIFSDNSLDFQGLCWKRYNGYVQTTNICPDAGAIDFLDLEPGPVKASYILNHHHNQFDGLLNSILTHSNYNSPQRVTYYNSFDYFVSHEENFVIRFQAIFNAPFTGNITFWLAGDDFAFLFIGDDETENSKQKIAQMDDLSGWNFYKKNSGTKSMVQGKKYYMEVLFKDVWSFDYYYLAMSGDLWYERVLVSHDYLEPYNG